MQRPAAERSTVPTRSLTPGMVVPFHVRREAVQELRPDERIGEVGRADSAPPFAPAMRNSMTSLALAMPPMPMIGIFERPGGTGRPS